MVLLRLIGLCQRDAAELTAVDTDLQQASESRNDALELHVFAAARAGAAGLLVHMANMTERAPAALTLINRANADGGKKPRLLGSRGFAAGAEGLHSGTAQARQQRG